MSFTAEISLVPQKTDLHLYAGDGATIRLKFVQQGSALDMSDGEMTAQIRVNRMDVTPAAEWAVDASDAENGVIVLTITGEETASLLQYFNQQRYRYGMKGSWDVQWHPTGREPVTLFQGDCYCNADVTR